jgi:uncharacterized RDD family membrane protein YckC
MEYEDRRTIATPEGVQLALPLGGIGTRFLTALIDLTIGSVVGIIVIMAAGFAGGDVAAAIASAASFLVFVVGYNVLFEVAGGGRTIGRRAAGLRVVMDSGAPVGLRASLIRNLIRILELSLFYLPAIVSILATKNNQRLGDLAAGTLVIRDVKAPAYEAPRTSIPPAQFQSWDVTGVGEAELMAVRTFLDRRYGFQPGPRAALAADLAAKLRPLVPGVRPGLHDEQFLEYLAAAKSGPSFPPTAGRMPPYG